MELSCGGGFVWLIFGFFWWGFVRLFLFVCLSKKVLGFFWSLIFYHSREKTRDAYALGSSGASPKGSQLPSDKYSTVTLNY